MTTQTAVPNPGLAPFDLSDYRGVRGRNFYQDDAVLRRLIHRHASEYTGEHRRDMEEHLSAYGKLAGGILDELTSAAHREGKYGEIVQFDSFGNRIDRVDYCAEQVESRRINYEHGMINLDFHPEWKHDFTMLHRMALAYLANMNGEAGVTCPLCMTDGMIRVLKALGTEEQKKKYLPLVAGKGSSSHFMAGQYLTERVGGSNVSANRTVARKGENGKWILNGEKWFCSNPGDLWVTTARVEGTSTIGMFLVPRLKEDGSLNGCRLTRKKDIIGSRGKVTAEVVYEELEAEELGRPSHGLANMIRYVINTSRLHVSVGTIGIGRRAYMEALAYTKTREAYARKIGAFASVRRNLAEMFVLQSAAVMLAFRNYMLADEGVPAAQILTPLMKYCGSIHSTWITHQAMMLHGGNGILGDFSCLPRLHNDSIINETWEGTHQIIAEHALKARSRPKARTSLEKLIEESTAPAANMAELEYALATLRELKQTFDGYDQSSAKWQESNRLYLCDKLYEVCALAVLIQEAAVSQEDREIYCALANGFAEIARRGKMGPTRPGGVFEDQELMEKLINY